MLPSDGYKVLPQPETYVPIRTPARKLMATPSHGGETPGGSVPDAGRGPRAGVRRPRDPGGAAGDEAGGLPILCAAAQAGRRGRAHRGAARGAQDHASAVESEERHPAAKKIGVAQLTDKARDLGAGPLFNQILPLLMSPTLEDQERHLLVKVVDRVLYKLDELVRPYVHKILVVIEPLLIDEDYYARVEGREIIANLAKAAGLATMIAAMRPDIDNVDEYVRNTTARAFAVVAQRAGRARAAARSSKAAPPPPLANPRVPTPTNPPASFEASSQEVVAGASHRRQDHAADRHPDGLRGAAAPARAWWRSSSTG